MKMKQSILVNILTIVVVAGGLILSDWHPKTGISLAVAGVILLFSYRGYLLLKKTKNTPFVLHDEEWPEHHSDHAIM